MHAAIWIITAICLGLWSLLAWGLNALLQVDLSVSVNVAAALDKLPFAAWLNDYIPAWRDLLLALASLAHASLAWLGAVAPWLLWAAWAVGAAALVFVALLLSGVVALVRRSTQSTQSTASAGNGGKAATGDGPSPRPKF